MPFVFFFSSRRRHTRLTCDWSSDVCSSDLGETRLSKGVARTAMRLKIARTTINSISVNPAGGSDLPVGDVAVLVFASLFAVVSQRIEIILTVIAGIPVHILPTPWIFQGVAILEIRPIPTRDLRRPVDERSQALFLGRKLAHIEAIEIENAGEFLDLNVRRLDLSAAEIFEYLRGGDGDQ